MQLFEVIIYILYLFKYDLKYYALILPLIIYKGRKIEEIQSLSGYNLLNGVGYRPTVYNEFSIGNILSHLSVCMRATWVYERVIECDKYLGTRHMSPLRTVARGTDFIFSSLFLPEDTYLFCQSYR